jgi:hypothetical protein
MPDNTTTPEAPRLIAQKFQTLEQGKNAHAKSGGFFFSSGSLKTFRTRLSNFLTTGRGEHCKGWVFVTSDRHLSPGYDSGRLYTVRGFVQREGDAFLDVRTLAKGFTNLNSALKAAQRIDGKLWLGQRVVLDDGSTIYCPTAPNPWPTFPEESKVEEESTPYGEQPTPEGVRGSFSGGWEVVRLIAFRDYVTAENASTPEEALEFVRYSLEGECDTQSEEVFPLDSNGDRKEIVQEPKGVYIRKPRKPRFMKVGGCSCDNCKEKTARTKTVLVDGLRFSVLGQKKGENARLCISCAGWLLSSRRRLDPARNPVPFLRDLIRGKCLGYGDEIAVAQTLKLLRKSK